eukprot:CAMPEP_0183718246 /NCGR_PEP_ID=MMETSP0737-20130205/11564_1 /TAXON_ID=385413 /ORGANISM="Thalassiosira miniscula, Strain CCMP1093" /LENGTH=291 /DNA_ID=CAMNT_0025947775 /DNA_START=25 /DNA_END=900 /DNA_ORIENTATION=+
MGFSIQISVMINAPIDVVWDALTNIRSWPSIYSSVAETEFVGNRFSRQRNSTKKNRRGTRSGNGSVGSHSASDIGSIQSNHHRVSESVSVQSQASNSHQSEPQTSTPFLGTKWIITRKSMLERQRYSTMVTVTRFSETVDKRSFTIASDQALGSTCSLKMTVESVTAPSADSSQTQTISDNNDDTDEGNRAEDTSITNPNHTQDRTEQTCQSSACQVTVIVAMIPYKFFGKLIGIMCCPCLLKHRVRVSMASDLQDLISYCEERVAPQSGRCDANKSEKKGRRSYRSIWHL